jgi:hypothetical protein
MVQPERNLGSVHFEDTGNFRSCSPLHIEDHGMKSPCHTIGPFLGCLFTQSDEPLDCPFSSMYSFGLHGISPSDTMIPYVALFMQGYIALPVYQFTPSSSDPELYDTELDSTAKEITIPVNLKKTALVVIDFWGDRISDNAFYDNTASLIYLARKHGIPVIHAPHEGLSLPRYRVNPRILPIPESEPVLTTETVESHFAKNNMNIDTLIYTGYATSECLLYTKPNSINNVARRTNKFRIILIKNATNAPYWSYLFAVNGIETKFMSSTLNNLSKALGDDVRAVEAVPSGYYSDPASYRIDDNFGLDLEFKKTALMLINIWDYHENDGWLKRIKYNTSKNILPLVQFARSKGMKIIHIPNGRKLDPTVKLDKDEPELKSIDEIRKYISDNGISTIIYAGNLINTTDLFPPIDVWGFTRDSSLPVVSRILEDCLIVFETKESLANQQFKKVFLERATSYTGAQHEVTTFSILQRNTRLRLIQPNERAYVWGTNSHESGFLRVIAGSPEREKSGEIVIGDRENTLFIPSRTIKGTANLVFSNWGKARADFYISGAIKLLLESENSDKWKPGYQNILYSDNASENLLFRFEGFYPIKKATLRLNARNYADRNDISARISFSCDGGKTYSDLDEKRTTYDDGNFVWYLNDIAPESQTLMVKIGLQSMNDHIGIESLRLNLDLRTDKVIDFDENSLYIENKTNIPIKFDIVKPIKLKKLPYLKEQNMK